MMDEAPHECTVIQTAAHTQLDISCFDLLTCRSVAGFQTQTWSLGGGEGWYIIQCHSDVESNLELGVHHPMSL